MYIPYGNCTFRDTTMVLLSFTHCASNLLEFLFVRVLNVTLLLKKVLFTGSSSITLLSLFYFRAFKFS